jgi:hypothetical protein
LLHFKDIYLFVLFAAIPTNHLLREYLLREYLLREYLLREYLLREYLLREYLLREYLLRYKEMICMQKWHNGISYDTRISTCRVTLFVVNGD